ncbi:MAG: IS5 family transposase [Candidatus Caenarcaniphilales bacterium]|nr:IS5 family transposase [Candidatus Caenarcaniphilales bacterium]
MQGSFLDIFCGTSKGTKSSKFLEEIDSVMPWYRINKLLSKWKDANTGRKGFSPETMFRMSLLKDFYGLSDADTEELINDRISFRRFMKIDISCPAPDETTLCRFRAWLTENNLQEKLFNLVNKYLDKKGFFVKKGSLVDATIVEAPMNKNNGEKDWIDKEASSTKKGSRWYRGYKIHADIDPAHTLFAGVLTTTAKVADITCLEPLLSGATESVIADKGYYSQELKRQLRSQGIHCGILDKAPKGKKLSNSQRKRNKKLSSARAFVEHPFNVIKNWFKFKKVRYVGIVKNTAHVFMLAMMHNIYKVRKLLEPELSIA